MHKDFPCGLCNLQQFPTDSSRGRGGLNLHSPALRVLDSELRETQTANYFSAFQIIDRAVWKLMAD